MLHSITFPGCKCLGITHHILKDSFLLLFREWLACRGCSKCDFTSTYGNPLFLEHFHIQTNICFSERSKTSITSKAVCPAAGLPVKGLKQLCQCYPLVTALQQKNFFAAAFQCKKYGWIQQNRNAMKKQYFYSVSNILKDFGSKMQIVSATLQHFCPLSCTDNSI